VQPIHVSRHVVVPAAAISLRMARSSGPGGQNVNKVASKVDLRVDPSAIEGLADDARLRLQRLAASRLDAAGRIRIVSQRTRDQRRNLEDAHERMRELVARSLVAPRRRRATQPSAAARERRLAGKKLSARRKAARKRAWERED